MKWYYVYFEEVSHFLTVFKTVVAVNFNLH